MEAAGIKYSRAIVVGASGGIGSAVAVALARQGVATALVGRNQASLTAVARDCEAAGSPGYPMVCDIARLDRIEGMLASAVEQLGGLNYLINCAGVSVKGKLHETDLAVSESVLNTNLRAHLYLARYALPEINRQPGGAVIKIGSVNHPYAGVNTYLASNRGGEGLAEAIFEDVREYGTRVCTIKPGYVNTPLVRDNPDVESALMVQPEDIAHTVLYVLTMPETACPTEITILPQRSPYR